MWVVKFLNMKLLSIVNVIGVNLIECYAKYLVNKYLVLPAFVGKEKRESFYLCEEKGSE